MGRSYYCPSSLNAYILWSHMEANMHFRNLFFVGALAFALALIQGSATAQTQPAKVEVKSARSVWKTPRTADGQPDLQGVWANNNATPLERPKELAGRKFLTEQEVAALKKKADELFSDGSSEAAFGDTLCLSVLANVQGAKKGFKCVDGETGDYSSVWTVQRDWDNRTALITDPADGRLPPMTPEAQKRSEAAQKRIKELPAGPEDRSLSERCITFGSPRLGAGYNSYFQIFQSPKVVALEMETIHDTRLIPLDGSPHLPANVRTWLGDSRGHWEGDTLVVDTTNYKPGLFMQITTEKLHVVERYTRTGPDSIQWEVTIDDPGSWTKPWTAMIPLRRSKEALYEYACHEGNYGLQGILAGARAEEKAAAGIQKTSSAK